MPQFQFNLALLDSIILIFFFIIIIIFIIFKKNSLLEYKILLLNLKKIKKII